VTADLDFMRRPALALQWSGTGQCWVILPGPMGDKIVFFAGTYSGTATCAVPKPEPPIQTFHCRIYAGGPLVWGGGSGTGRQRPHMRKCRSQSGRYVVWAGVMRQRTGISIYGYGSRRLWHGTHDVRFRAPFKPMAHETQAKGALQSQTCLLRHVGACNLCFGVFEFENTYTR
jgi:hypothetical protein